MVMGPTHAVSGAAAWLVASAVAETAFNFHQGPTTLALGTVACTGAALLPDLDCSGRVLKNKGGATVARTFGVASLFLAECVEKFSLGVYKITRSKKDGKKSNGHRTFTHTWLFAALLGVGVGALAYNFGRPAVAAMMFLLTGLAIRGVMNDWAKKQGWWIITLISLAVAVGLHQELPDHRPYVVLGAAVGIGCVVHTFGDMITKMGCPVLFPVPIQKRRWKDIGVPDKIAIRAGSKVEEKVLMPLFVTIAVAALLFTSAEVRGTVGGWMVAAGNLIG
ncbi:metal-dependent hydrolase [Stackebrandtia nassauensis]|uniref:Membrane-bound metal-dependent hydrolase n=1 Tax=Stackebrandtia nassauensis (strain DSM 44728 / CIP 108903 / NRRL B-16338 / NBRC 102104 / LLR-40K-21) TaxID=446470 RepID=D3PZ08_STANL|nr:metal-dependent hydrolase [Stackebrandtia nassauensis]ADD45437.1 membrane-bound metal-dependent hydrolase [Stackebrandtia nassauensis DSM 44728]